MKICYELVVACVQRRWEWDANTEILVNGTEETAMKRRENKTRFLLDKRWRQQIPFREM